jgi:hypothetical protein
MNYTEEQIENIVTLFRVHLHALRRCFYCGIKTRRMKPREVRKNNAQTVPMDACTSEHVIPKCEGGYLTVFCCKRCNEAKGPLSLEEFRALRYEGKAIEFYFETEMRLRGLI